MLYYAPLSRSPVILDRILVYKHSCLIKMVAEEADGSLCRCINPERERAAKQGAREMNGDDND